MKSAISRLFTAHPASVGETYMQHLGHACRFGMRMVVAGSACLIHAILPFLFLRTGSRAVEDLHWRMVANRRPVSDATVADTVQKSG